MRSIVIDGPSSLSGRVKVQGAKNSAMKHVLIPLLTNDKFVLKNIPNIGSCHNLLEVVKLQGGVVDWRNNNTVHIDTTNVTESKPIPADVFYYTSGAIHAIPILVSKYGKCVIELHSSRKDTGGDAIGSRSLDIVMESLKKVGIDNRKNDNFIEFFLGSDEPFEYEVPVKAFSASVNSVFSALFKKGKSTIYNYTGEADFRDIVDFLIAAGADILIDEDKIVVNCPTTIKGVEYNNMFDRHDFVTFLSAAISTNSEVTIENVDYEKMKLDVLQPVIDRLGVELEFTQNSCLVKQVNKDLNPVEIYAGLYPKFITEWQVLFSPVYLKCKGESKVVETVFGNRMQHWNELKKMGANFEFIQDPNYAEENGMPRAVRVYGPSEIIGAEVEAKDLRSGACLVIAGLNAKGKTVITGIEHIERGYEDLVGRLKSLEAAIEIVD